MSDCALLFQHISYLVNVYIQCRLYLGKGCQKMFDCQDLCSRPDPSNQGSPRASAADTAWVWPTDRDFPELECQLYTVYRDLKLNLNDLNN